MWLLFNFCMLFWFSLMASFIVPSFMSASFQHMLVTYFTIGLLFPRRCTNEAYSTFCLLLKPHFTSAYKPCTHRRGYLSKPPDNIVLYCSIKAGNKSHSSTGDVHSFWDLHVVSGSSVESGFWYTLVQNLSSFIYVNPNQKDFLSSV